MYNDMDQHIRDQHRAAQIDSQRFDRLQPPPQTTFSERWPELDLPCIKCGWSKTKCDQEVTKSGTVCCMTHDHKDSP